MGESRINSNKKGLINLLTVVPIVEIENKCIPYIRKHFDESLDKKKFDDFWGYFVRTWMNMYPPCDWNINGKLRFQADVMINRTNNPLERFNRRINDSFKKGSRPNIVTFVVGIRDVSNCDRDTYIRVRDGHSKAPPHQPITCFQIPNSYISFKVDKSIQISRSATIEGYNFMIDTTHYDHDDKKLYRVTRIAYFKDDLVGYRMEMPMDSTATCSSEEDCISIYEILDYMNIKHTCV